MDVNVALIEERPSVEATYRADGDRLWRAIYAWAGDSEVANDAVAEAFAQLIHRGQGVRDPASWAWRTAFRVAAGAMKARRTPKVFDLTEVGGASGRAEPAYLDRYGDPDLLAALRRLPDGQRAAVILFYYADLPVAAIASRLGSNQLAVRANLSRGRRRLRQLLGENDG
jgi:RNA polymerase sigma factor (sigma-70 family)